MASNRANDILAELVELRHGVDSLDPSGSGSGPGTGPDGARARPASSSAHTLSKRMLAQTLPLRAELVRAVVLERIKAEEDRLADIVAGRKHQVTE